MRAAPTSAWETQPIHLHRHHLPQGRVGRPRPALPAQALPLGVAHQGTGLAEGIILSVRGWELPTRGTPAAEAFQGRSWRCGCVCIYTRVYVRVLHVCVVGCV